jgi:cytochrome oxidase Cu insertion factor (SCO1/SenC/PrrC family)
MIRDVTFLFSGVESVRDTPDAIRCYLNDFDSEFGGFSPDDMILSLIQSNYGFYYQRRLNESTQSICTIDHSTFWFATAYCVPVLLMTQAQK